MIMKKIAVFFLLTLAILTGIPGSFAYPQNGGSCSSCHNKRMNKDMAISNIEINKNVGLNPGNVQEVSNPGQMMDFERYLSGIIGTDLIIVSQFYSLRKRVLKRRR